jgi:hypothetical protein
MTSCLAAIQAMRGGADPIAAAFDGAGFQPVHPHRQDAGAAKIIVSGSQAPAWEPPLLAKLLLCGRKLVRKTHPTKGFFEQSIMVRGAHPTLTLNYEP